ncbi:MAG: alpha/beta hydrolase [Anaerolineaceae bacterium]
MNIRKKMEGFEKKFGKTIVVGQKSWRYYRLGTGTPVLWLTGGLRRTALGFSFLEELAGNHTVIAPDYPTTRTIDEFMQAFDDILRTEKIDRFILAGQSYGSLLAQAYLSERPERVEALVISSGGPADYGRVWLAADYLAMGLVRLLPVKSAKKLIFGGLLKALPLPGGESAEWLEAIQHILNDELTRADVYSHFGVAADLIKTRIIRPEVFQKWQGRVIVMSAANDPTQSAGDIPRFERLFGRPVEQVGLGDMGHAALLFDPVKYCSILEKALEG